MGAPRKDLNDEVILKVYNETNSIAETARKLNTTYHTIDMRLVKMGLKIGREEYQKKAVSVKLPPLTNCEGGIAVKRDKLDKVLKLKVGMSIRVKVNDRIRTRKIDKIYEHFVMVRHPNGYRECFTKSEVLMYNFGKGDAG